MGAGFSAGAMRAAYVEACPCVKHWNIGLLL